jgi:hypothetical protein
VLAVAVLATAGRTAPAGAECDARRTPPTTFG